MLCDNPFVKGGKAFGCGQCMPCRVNRNRVWNHRIMLEASLHSQNAFVTLTYAPDKLPKSYKGQYVDKVVEDPLPTLDPKDLQDWLKRIRKAMAPIRLRFYAVGEYGDLSQLPHYHAILFGYPSCSYLRSRYSSRIVNCCEACDRIRDSWRFGIVDIGEVNEHSAAYIAGYVTKKMTAKDDFRLQGRHAEFARMSLRPGIGADMMDEVASTFMSFNLENREGDVPSSLAHGRRNLPLGRYLTRRLRARVGRDEAAPREVLEKIEKELLPLREAAFNASRPLKDAILDANAGRRAGVEARRRIFKKRGSI